MGFLIVIDGLDGSGKNTQSTILYERLKKEGRKVRMISFPQYESPSSALVKMYLGGEFGNNPDDVNSYAASSFYAVDRFASYKTDWKKDYDEGAIIIANRYTTANAIHQLTKLDKSQHDKFLKWLYDYEFCLLGLPAPDLTIFLEVPPEKSFELINIRGEKKDIHENKEHLKRAYEAAVEVSEKWKWTRIDCMANEKEILPIEKISETVYETVKERLPK